MKTTQRERHGSDDKIAVPRLRDRSGPRTPRRGGPGRPDQPPGTPRRQRPLGGNQTGSPDRSSRPPGRVVRPGGPRPGAGGTPPDQRRGRGGKDTRPDEKPFRIRGELLFGRNAILETLRSARRRGTRLWVAEGMREDVRVDEIVELARASEVLVETVPRTLLDDMEPDVNHQGVLLEVPEFPYADLEDVVARPGTVLVLDHLADPQNFGTLLRAADAAGIAGAVIPADRSASISPAVVNSSSGAVEHLEIALVPNLGRALDKLEQSGRWIVGLDGGDDALELFSADVPMPVALVVGSEGRGLTANIRKRCQMLVRLPMQGQVSSLNAATAGAIALFDIVRRQHAESPSEG